jgi:hypothetical protein
MQLSKGTRWFVYGSLMAVAIYLGASYLIHRGLSPSPKSAGESKSAPVPANEAKFRFLLEAGDKFQANGQYADALAQYLEAEHSGEVLTDQQYESLKKARLQVAQLYERADSRSEAESVYRVLAACALQQGRTLLQAKQFEQTLARAQDAEQFSDQLNEGKRESLQQAVYLSVNALTGLQRYAEAGQAEQRMIDYLKSSADDYDKAFSEEYVNLANIYASAKDWQGSEQALVSAIDACDRTLAHYSLDKDQMIVAPTLISKNWAQYNLVIAYYREGNTETSLARAEDLYRESFGNRQDPLHPVNVAYHGDDFASLALQIAIEAKNQEAVDHWSRRAGNLKVVSLHP